MSLLKIPLNFAFTGFIHAYTITKVMVILLYIFFYWHIFLFEKSKNQLIKYVEVRLSNLLRMQSLVFIVIWQGVFPIECHMGKF